MIEDLCSYLECVVTDIERRTQDPTTHSNFQVQPKPNEFKDNSKNFAVFCFFFFLFTRPDPDFIGHEWRILSLWAPHPLLQRPA